MQSNSERFTNRFQTLFAEGGLTNIKFFVRNHRDISLNDFFEEAADIQSTIAAGDFKVITSIDGDAPQKRFDAAF